MNSKYDYAHMIMCIW